MRKFAAFALVVGGLGVFAPGRASGQGAIGVQPTVGTIPDGVGMSVTPSVTADRRYVRLSLGVGFNTVQGFQNINFPIGAVGMGGGRLGGGGGGGVLGALGGAGGGAGGGGGGAMSVLSGMDGPIAPGGATPAGSQGMMGPAGYGYGYGPGFDGAYFPETQVRRPAPRRAKPKARPKAVAAKAETPAAKPK